MCVRVRVRVRVRACMWVCMCAWVIIHQHQFFLQFVPSMMANKIRIKTSAKQTVFVSGNEIEQLSCQPRKKTHMVKKENIDNRQ